MEKYVRLLTKSDSKKYQQLMKESLGSAEGFAVHRQSTEWTMTDDAYPLFAAFHGEDLVSVMRVESVLSQKELKFKLDEDFSVEGLSFPAMYLAKAGTSPSLKASGLNALLRYHSLKLAQAWGARFVFGVMAENSPRVFSMNEMGYVFKEKKEKWDGNFVSDQKILIACLDLQKSSAQAFAYLE